MEPPTDIKAGLVFKAPFINEDFDTLRFKLLRSIIQATSDLESNNLSRIRSKYRVEVRQ